jgi:hypothetical protein
VAARIERLIDSLFDYLITLFQLRDLDNIKKWKAHERWVERGIEGDGRDIFHQTLQLSILQSYLVFGMSPTRISAQMQLILT